MPRLQDGVAVRPEDVAGKVPHRWLVFDQEDGLVTPSGLREARTRHRRIDGLPNARQVNLERRAAPWFAVDPDVSVALLDDPIDRREPQPCPVAWPFGGEEGLKDVGLGLRGHADPGVTDRQHHVRARMYIDVAPRVGRIQLCIGRLEGEPAPFGHGIAGVGGQVHHDLLDLARVGFHVAERRVERRHQSDVLPDQPSQHLGHIRHDCTEIQHRGLEHLLPAES